MKPSHGNNYITLNTNENPTKAAMAAPFFHAPVLCPDKAQAAAAAEVVDEEVVDEVV